LSANTRRDFTADVSLPRDGSWLIDAVGAEFGVRREAGSSLRSVWLDSADWRLLRAGLVAHQTGRGTARELKLENLAGETILAEPVGVTWPSLIDASAASALQARLAEALGVRALLAKAEVDTRRSPARLVDGEDKTVVFATVEDARLVGPNAKPLPLRITLTAVRGYERELRRAADLLAMVSGVEAATGSARESALAAAGCPAGETTGKPDLLLDGSAPAATSVARILLGWLDVVEANLAGCSADVDTEFLHDMRIAVRQTRTVLKALGDVLPDGVAERFRAEWRWLGALTTPTRDLDVVLLGLEGRSDEFDISGLTGLEPLYSDLARLRRTEFRRLRAGLASARLTTLLRDWRAALTEIDPVEVTSATTADVAGHRLGRAHRRVVKHAAIITADSDAESMHDLRKRCKELRYLLEAFASIYDEKARRRVVKDLKYLQDQLGEVQDSHIHRSMLTAFVHSSGAAPAPPETILAVGALIDRLDSRRRQAHTDLTVALHRLTDAKITGRLSPRAEAAA
jgi:CHAD domain-containing protein